MASSSGLCLQDGLHRGLTQTLAWPGAGPEEPQFTARAAVRTEQGQEARECRPSPEMQRVPACAGPGTQLSCTRAPSVPPCEPRGYGRGWGTPFSVSESQTISISHQEHQDQEGCQT